MTSCFRVSSVPSFSVLQSSALAVLRRIVAEEGSSGLYKGIQSQLVRTVLASALMLTVKERLNARTALALQIAVFVFENPAFVASMVRSRINKAFS